MLVENLRDGTAFVAATDIIQLDDGTRHLARRPLHITADALLCRNVVGNQALARHHDVIACGAFDESMTVSQDYDLWIRLVLHAGAGIGLREPLQIIHAQGGRDRITTSERRRSGLWKLYRKHVSHMSRPQRRSHLFNLIRMTGRPMSLRKALTLWSRQDQMRIIAHYLRQRGLIDNHLAERIASRRDRREILMALHPDNAPSKNP
jgi:hypothetical protein